MTWLKHQLKYIKRRAKRLLRIDWSLDDMNDHIRWEKWKQSNRMCAWTPGQWKTKRKD